MADFGSSVEFSGSLSSSTLPPPRTRIFKIIVIGDSGVGKTCLTYRFCAGKFPEKTEATIGVDFRERLVEIDGEKIKIQLWDTAGQERFRKSMVQHYYRNVHAVVFVYDVTNAVSFRSLPAWIEECKQHALGTEVPRILVGNKCDLQDSVQVGTDVAQQFADAHSMPLFETSAKNPSSNDDGSCQNSDHVEAIFMTVAHKLKSQKPLVLSQPPGGSGDTVNLSRGRDNGANGANGARSWGCSSC
ncbi:RAB33B, member RAS oncogene family a [Sphaeramia orbicularis]|uniref:small monomeric GTPase n=1 Tax=Sphaeramia orbicularis TaxID=375764 RepID=A0A672ZW04_9TELE|nr:ras-related protein Rab-33B-like [Sphaeramia orbicularis]XP_030001747.1 ras-related protein Rab-33B-like [Sphaeramia orbicularis]